MNRHKGTIYQAANFEKVRVNARGIETYRRTLRPLTSEEHAIIAKRSLEDKRAQRLRTQIKNDQVKQLLLIPDHC